MASVTQTCAKCNKQFLVIDMEQQFLQQRGLSLPTNCPSCRQMRRLALRGGRQLFKSTCQKCGKEIVVAFDPSAAKSPILCKEDFDQYFAENDAIISDPLPEV